jgi:hypothetical protein
METLQLTQPSEFMSTALLVAATLTAIAAGLSSLAIAAFLVTEKARDFESG